MSLAKRRVEPLEHLFCTATEDWGARLTAVHLNLSQTSAQRHIYYCRRYFFLSGIVHGAK